jgi:hypothetical protein
MTSDGPPDTPTCVGLFRQAVRVHWADTEAVCARCRLAELDWLGPFDVSHFFNVRWSGTRFDPANVDPLHRACHTGGDGWEYKKHQGAPYHTYMLKKLGQDRLRSLGERAHKQMSLEAAKAEFIEKLEGGTLWGE